jgi:hypothetical protein
MKKEIIRKNLKRAYKTLKEKHLKKAREFDSAIFMKEWLEKVQGRYGRGLIGKYLEDHVDSTAKDFISAIDFIPIMSGFNVFTEDSQGLKIQIILRNNMSEDITNILRNNMSEDITNNRFDDFPSISSKIAKDFFLNPDQIIIDFKYRTPRDSFMRLKDKRLNDVKKKLKLLKNLSDSRNYGNNYKQWLDIKKDLMYEYIELIESFEGRESAQSFKSVIDFFEEQQKKTIKEDDSFIKEDNYVY